MTDPVPPATTTLASTVLFASDVAATVGFYRVLGLPLEDEDHGDGALHAACDLGDVHVAVLPGIDGPISTARRAAGTTFTGFWVDSLDRCVAALDERGAPVVLRHEHCEWGCRAILSDPDGRPVEINQRDHCPGPAPG